MEYARKPRRMPIRPYEWSLKNFNAFTGITKNYKAQKIGITQKKLSTFPADSSHVRALTNISTNYQKITAPK